MEDISIGMHAQERIGFQLDAIGVFTTDEIKLVVLDSEAVVFDIVERGGDIVSNHDCKGVAFRQSLKSEIFSVSDCTFYEIAKERKMPTNLFCMQFKKEERVLLVSKIIK